MFPTCLHGVNKYSLSLHLYVHIQCKYHHSVFEAQLGAPKDFNAGRQRTRSVLNEAAVGAGVNKSFVRIAFRTISFQVRCGLIRVADKQRCMEAFRVLHTEYSFPMAALRAVPMLRNVLNQGGAESA